jgi:hypothetical protein
VKHFVVACALVAAAATVLAAAPADPTLARWVVRVYYDDPADIRQLSDFDLWEYNDRAERYVLVAIDPADWPRLEQTGLRLALDEPRTQEINAPREPLPGQTTAIPGFPCYRTVEETFATAQAMTFEHPDLAAWIDVGDSWEKESGLGGYDMRVLRLTNAAVPGPKPKLVVTASIHAREYTPAELVTRFAESLVEGHGIDADATWILDHHEVHLMLQANPDGRKQAETGLSWRKNTNQAYCSPTSTSRGADLNRNFEFEWGCCGGSSGSQCNTTYRGPFAASEPEVRSVQDYLLAVLPDQRADPLDAPAPADATGVYLDIHSFSELVLWPWGFGGPAPNSTPLRTLGRKFAYFNGYTPQQAIDLYVTDGTTIDFAYGELGVAAFVFELGTSFFQSCAVFENTILPENLPALIYAAKVARTPYLTPAGPDALQVAPDPPVIFAGQPFALEATIDDTRYEQGNGVEPTQAVAAAEYWVDVPPWAPGAGAATGMFAADGVFDSAVEAVTATVATTGLAPGRHTLFVRGRDAAGNWGAFSAAFVTLSDESGDDDDDGAPNGTDCAPADGALWNAPSEARDLRVHKTGFATLTWLPPLAPGSTVVTYEALRATSGDGFAAALCLPSQGSSTVAADYDVPAPESAFYYLVRALNPCGSQLGVDSTGQSRVGVDCTP